MEALDIECVVLVVFVQVPCPENMTPTFSTFYQGNKIKSQGTMTHAAKKRPKQEKKKRSSKEQPTNKQHINSLLFKLPATKQMFFFRRFQHVQRILQDIKELNEKASTFARACPAKKDSVGLRLTPFLGVSEQIGV